MSRAKCSAISKRDTAETPGDDVDAAIPQPGRGVLRGRDSQFVERLDPAGCSSQRDQAIGGRPQQFVEQGFARRAAHCAQA